jgi:hypothetical protein
MKQKIHMHDQVFNKVEDIMNHYKRNPIDGLIRILKQFIKQSSVIWCRLDSRDDAVKNGTPW